MSAMRFSWSETKRARNLKDHGLDFIDAPRVFEGTTLTFEDDRFSYGEQRFVTLGLLTGVPVSIVHTESEHEIRVISFRTATKRETQIYFEQLQNRLGALRVRAVEGQTDGRASGGECKAYRPRYCSAWPGTTASQVVYFVAG